MSDNCKLYNVHEHDIDFLIMREISMGGNLLNELLRAANRPRGTLIEISKSIWDEELGETDILILVGVDSERHALLIEDKINARHMPRQYDRYLQRGQKGIEDKSWDDFEILLIAPKSYIDSESEAKKYPNTYTYEQLKEYFNDGQHQFDVALLDKAFEKKDAAYDLVENEAVTKFWKQYLEYQTNKHPSLESANKATAKGLYSSWVQYYVCMRKEMILYHKLRNGYVDLQISGVGGHEYELDNLLREMGIDIKQERVIVVNTGKSASIRTMVEAIDNTCDFDEVPEYIKEFCFDALERMMALADRFDKVKMSEFINNCKN